MGRGSAEDERIISSIQCEKDDFGQVFTSC